MRLDTLAESGPLLDDVRGRNTAQHLVRAVVVLRLEPLLEVGVGVQRRARGVVKPSLRKPVWISGTDMNSRHSSPERWFSIMMRIGP